MAVQFPRFPGDRQILLDQPAEPVATGAGHQGPQPNAPGYVHQAPPQGTPRRPMPPSNFELMRLPPELQLAIMREIHNNPDRAEATRSMDALIANREQHTVNSYSHAVLNNDKKLARSHMKLRRMIAEVHQLPISDVKFLPVQLLRMVAAEAKKAAFNADSALEDDLDKLVQFTYWSERLSALDEHQADHLVDFAVTFNDRNMEENLSMMIGAMGPGLHRLGHEQHVGLVDTITDMSAQGISQALENFGQGLGALHADCVKDLVDAVVQMTGDEAKSNAICGIAEGMDALTPGQCKQLAQAALSIQEDEYRDNAIAALGPHLHRFDAAVQMALVDGALALRDTDEHQVLALDAVARGMSSLAPDDYASVLSKLVSAMPQLSSPSKANLMATCASALQPSDNDNVRSLHERLVSDALALAVHEGRVHVVGSFGASLHALSDESRDRVVTSALDSARAQEDNALQAIATLSNGWKSLTVDQAALMFQALLDARDETIQSRAMATVLEGEGASALSPDQLDVLVIKAVGMNSEENRSAVVRRFGPVLPALMEKQLNKLVMATATLTDPQLKCGTIQGLANMEGVHRNHLIDVTRQLPLELRIDALKWLAASLG